MMANPRPVLSKHFFADRVRSDVVGTKTLHTEIVDEAIFHSVLNLGFDRVITNLIWDEPHSDREPISTQTPKSEWCVDALKGANLDFAVPIFGTLLADQVLSVASVDSHSLGGDAAFVLVTGDLELFGHLFHAFGDVVDCYAGLDVGLLHDYRQVVGIGLHVFLRSLVLLTQFLPLSVLVAHSRNQE